MASGLGKRSSCSVLPGVEGQKRCRSLLSLSELLEVGKSFPDLQFCVNSSDSGENVLVCSRKELHNHPPLGMIHRVKILVKEDGNYDLQVTFYSKETGIVC